MATYQYDSVTETIEIEIDPSWAEVISGMDDEEQHDGRKHKRPDHKYAPGVPLSLEGLRYEGSWLENRDCCIAASILYVDYERALAKVTELQRRYFVAVRQYGYSRAEIARSEGKHKFTVWEIVEAAKKNIKNILK